MHHRRFAYDCASFPKGQSVTKITQRLFGIQLNICSVTILQSSCHTILRWRVNHFRTTVGSTTEKKSQCTVKRPLKMYRLLADHPEPLIIASHILVKFSVATFLVPMTVSQFHEVFCAPGDLFRVVLSRVLFPSYAWKAEL